MNQKEFEAKFDVILDASSPTFAEDFRAALGLKPGEKLSVIGPQFERTDGKIVSYCPNTPEEYAALHLLPETTLKKIGCQKWDTENGVITWLFPKEWYGSIPDGTDVIDIMGKSTKFKKGETDDDIRFGALSFGFTQTDTGTDSTMSKAT